MDDTFNGFPKAAFDSRYIGLIRYANACRLVKYDRRVRFFISVAPLQPCPCARMGVHDMSILENS